MPTNKWFLAVETAAYDSFLKGKKVDPSLLEKKERYKESFKEFIVDAWPYIDPAPYMDNWHIDALCDHLQALYEGDIKRLILNVPPRCSKTNIGCIAFPAWVWANEPQHKFIYGSHSLKLAGDSSLKCRDLILSPWYRGIFGNDFSLRKDNLTKTYFSNDKMGARLCVSVESSIIGFGADTLYLDDINSATGVESENKRDSANMWIDRAASTRINNEENSRFVIQQQRLHEKDASGYYLAKEMPNTVHLYIPMEFESSRRCRTFFGEWAWEDPRQEEGELLWPERFKDDSIDNKKISLGSYAYAGQYQQRPAPAEGGIFKEEWFGWWCEPRPPKCEFVIQSWDTALTGHDPRSKNSDPCYSACTTWGVFNDENNVPNLILLDLWRGKVEYPNLRKMAIRLANNYHDTVLEDEPLEEGPQPDMVLIEAKVSGYSLYDDLRVAGIPVVKFNPNKHGIKTARARSASALVEAGRVWLPAKPPHYDDLLTYAQQFVDLCLKFPNDESNDIVDSMSQALIKIRESGWVRLPDDEELTPDPDVFRDKPLY